MRERVWRGSTLTHRDWVEFDQQRCVLRSQWQSYFESVGLKPDGVVLYHRPWLETEPGPARRSDNWPPF